MKLCELFDLPRKYQVNISLEPTEFLKRANLTQKEKSDLKILSSVEILYDLKFFDGSESIVIGANIKHLKDKFTVQNIAKIIATSIPYLSVVVVRVGHIVKVAMLKSKPNHYDSGRRVVTEFTCTDEIRLDKASKGSLNVIKQISNSYYQSSSSKEFNLKLIKIADSIKEDRRINNDNIERDYRRWCEEVKRQSDALSRFITAVYDDRLDYNDVPFTTNTSYEKSYVEDFGNFGYGLYTEYSEIYNIESVYIWLEFYIRICSEYARELDILEFSKNDIEKIVSIISKEEDYRENGFFGELIDIDDFKDFINNELEYFLDEVIDELFEDDE
jgi:hypothetical protein